MKGNDKMIDKLNSLLADELTAINQYFVHAEMCENWGYERLHEKIKKRAIDEMKHAEKLIARILFLEGRPIVSNLNKINIGPEVPAQHKSDWDAEDWRHKELQRWNPQRRRSCRQRLPGTTGIDTEG